MKRWAGPAFLAWAIAVLVEFLFLWNVMPIPARSQPVESLSWQE
jgi:hypothetical protein